MSKKDRNIQLTVAKGILLPAFIMLVVAALTFVTATYAWFSTTVPYNIDDIGMSVGSKGGVYVSADCENWSSNVTKEDLLVGYAGSRNVLPANQIAPVSSAGLLDGNAPVFFSGNETPEGVLAERIGEPSAQSTYGDFYAYDLFFRVDADATLYLGEGSTVSDAVKSATPISASARVAFVNYGNAADSVTARGLSVPSGNEFLAGYKAVDIGAYLDPQESYYYKKDGAYVRIKDYELTWELFDGYKRKGNLFVRDNSVINDTPVRIWEPNAATHTASVAAGGVLETRAVVAPGLVGADNTAAVADNVLFNDLGGFRNDLTYVAAVKQGYNKVRIYIWIEGQDADALNEASGRSFSAALRFVLG